MDATSVVQQIIKLATAIYDQAQLVKANRAQCVLLAQRVQTIQGAVKKLGKIPDSQAYRRSLEQLKICLTEALQYVQGLAGEKWYWQFIHGKSHQNKFTEFHTRLAQAITQLNLGLSAQAIVNREADRKAEATDRAELLRNQNTLLKLNRDLLGQINQLPDKEFQERQMAAVTAQLQVLTREVKALQSPTTGILDEKIAIPYYELRLEKIIGEGSFGTVYLGRWQDRSVAIKMWKGRLSNLEQPRFIREVQVLQRLNTPRFVPQFYGACLEDGRACLVMEYCPEGSLYDYLTMRHLTSAQQQHLAFSLLEALQFLHQKKVIHGDLKSANVLLMRNADLLEAKITDFGLSKAHYPSIASTTETSQAFAWCAPEILQGGKLTYASDVFSVGTLLWEIFTGRRPFAERTALKEWIVSGQRESCAGIPLIYTDWIMRCWASEPSRRPSITELVTGLSMTSVALSLPLSKSEAKLTTQGDDFLLKSTVMSDPASEPLTLSASSSAALSTEFGSSLRLDNPELKTVDKGSAGAGMQRWQIRYEELEFKKSLGKGAYGEVFAGLYRKSQVAIKVYDFHGQLNDKQKLEILREADVMEGLRSEYLIGFRGICLDPRYCLVMEYGEAGTLRARLDNTHQPIALTEQLRWGMQISYGLYQLHTVRIIHRDLKGENVLLDGRYHAKVADFGLSLIKSSSISQSKKGGHQGAAGTLPWMAPELFERKPNSPTTDVYSLGMVLWEIVSRQMPFAEAMPAAIVGMVLMGKREILPDLCPPVFSLMIQACWNSDPAKRPVAEVVGDQFAAALRSVEAPPAMMSSEEKENKYNDGPVEKSSEIDLLDLVLSPISSVTSLSTSMSHSIFSVSSSSPSTSTISTPSQSVVMPFSTLNPLLASRDRKQTTKKAKSPASSLVFTDETVTTVFANKAALRQYIKTELVKRPPIGILTVQLATEYKEKSLNISSETVWSGHKREVCALAARADGGLISGSKDTTIQIWSASGGVERTLAEHKREVQALAILSDEKLASGSADSTIKIWDLQKGACLSTFTGHGDGIRALVTLPDGRLASGSRDTTIRIWDLVKGACVAQLVGHKAGVYAFAVLQSGRLASASYDKTVKVWDIDQKICLTTFKGHTHEVTALAVLPSGNLISGALDGTLKVWDRKLKTCKMTLAGHQAAVNTLVVLPDGRWLSGSADKTVKLWVGSECKVTFTGHTSPVYALAVFPEGVLVSGSDMVRRWAYPAIPSPVENRIDLRWTSVVASAGVKALWKDDGVILTVQQPCAEALHQAAAAWQTLYPQHRLLPLKTTSASLHLTGLKPPEVTELLEITKIWLRAGSQVRVENVTSSQQLASSQLPGLS